jgi:glutathione synthase/RimK-type ligase-like ATP-grasp enzyme
MSNLCYRNNKLLAPPKTHTKQNKTEEKKHQTTLEDEAEEDEDEEAEDYFALIQRITQKSKFGSVARLLDPRTNTETDPPPTVIRAVLRKLDSHGLLKLNPRPSFLVNR